MIGNYFLNGVNSVLEWIVSQLPAYTGLPSALVDGFNLFAGKMAGACSFLAGPCQTAGIIIRLSIYIAIGIVIFETVAWIFHWKQAK